MLPVIFQKKLFVFLFCGFIVATVIGTLSHECGHWVVAKYYGHNARIGYAYTSYGKPNDEWLKRYSLLDEHFDEYTSGQNFAQKDEYIRLMEEREREGFLMTAGGPLQTILTGTLGFLLLFLLRKKFTGREQLSIGQWVLVFLSLFWLREIFNLVTAVVKLFTGTLRMRSDEFGLAKRLQWHPWSISIALSAISVAVLWVVVFRFIPARQRFTFIAAGISGGLVGAYLWLVLLGPRLMP